MMEKYEEIKTIGKGSFGRAILVRRREDNELLVVKQINIMEMSEKERDDSMNEVNLLSSLNNENIIAYHDSFILDGCLHIVMEYANAGDIHLEIKKRIIKKKPFKEFEILSWFAQICNAIQYISQRNILHRDLKTQNIFLTIVDNRYIIKLADFGISKILNSDTSFAKTVIGTPYYLSPEICEDKPYDHKSDIWSLGCVLYELSSLKHAFNANSLSGLLIKILKGTYPPIPSYYSSDLRNLISSMLQTDPKKRPSINDILGMSFLKPYIGKDLKPFSADDPDPDPIQLPDKNLQNNIPMSIARSSSQSNLAQPKVSSQLKVSPPSRVSPPQHTGNLASKKAPSTPLKPILKKSPIPSASKAKPTTINSKKLPLTKPISTSTTTTTTTTTPTKAPLKTSPSVRVTPSTSSTTKSTISTSSSKPISSASNPKTPTKISPIPATTPTKTSPTSTTPPTTPKSTYTPPTTTIKPRSTPTSSILKKPAATTTSTSIATPATPLPRPTTPVQTTPIVATPTPSTSNKVSPRTSRPPTPTSTSSSNSNCLENSNFKTRPTTPVNNTTTVPTSSPQTTNTNTTTLLYRPPSPSINKPIPTATTSTTPNKTNGNRLSVSLLPSTSQKSTLKSPKSTSNSTKAISVSTSSLPYSPPQQLTTSSTLPVLKKQTSSNSLIDRKNTLKEKNKTIINSIIDNSANSNNNNEEDNNNNNNNNSNNISSIDYMKNSLLNIKAINESNLILSKDSTPLINIASKSPLSSSLEYNNNNNKCTDENEYENIKSKKLLASRVNALKHFCNSIFGENLFQSIYNFLKHEYYDENDEVIDDDLIENHDNQKFEKLKELAGEEKFYYIKYVQQLLYCENKV